ncbi:PIN domain-containing protein [Candidatus Woesearchaeota archaeon]|nr:PIN domain-containing protein [Candidatus Woesearchaeota archaeon]
MIVILDANEYINYISNKILLLDRILSDDKILIYINETITKEVINNLSQSLIKDFYDFLLRNNISVYYEKIPFHLLQKYKKLGLKKGDIAIAAFCENINADYLITENRHFLKSKKFDKFKVLSLKEFLGKLK